MKRVKFHFLKCYSVIQEMVKKNYLIDFLPTLKHKKRKEIHEIVCFCGSNNMIFPYLSKSSFFVRVSLKLHHLFWYNEVSIWCWGSKIWNKANLTYWIFAEKPPLIALFFCKKHISLSKMGINWITVKHEFSGQTSIYYDRALVE